MAVLSKLSRRKHVAYIILRVGILRVRPRRGDSSVHSRPLRSGSPLGIKRTKDTERPFRCGFNFIKSYRILI